MYDIILVLFLLVHVSLYSTSEHHVSEWVTADKSPMSRYICASNHTSV